MPIKVPTVAEVHPYFDLEENVWVFDDDVLDISRERFVGNTNTLISLLTADFAEADYFTLTVSDAPIDNYTVVLTHIAPEEAKVKVHRPPNNSDWYGQGEFYRVQLCEKIVLDVWLCEVLYRYFGPQAAPETLYVRAQEARRT